jgi:hypothetical protein
MNTVIVKLSQVKVNGDNPRTITSDKLNKLINSILVFPKMLGIRPVVVDDKMVALGGNMRLNALKLIAKMSPEELGTRLATIADYLKKSAGERENIARHWEAWLQKPTVEIIKANELTEDERKQFIIKDNVAFGTWDYDMLANNFDEDMLNDWGMDVWAFKPIAEETEEKSDDDGVNFEDALPEELRGVDLSPAGIPKITGEDERAYDYLSITYKSNETKMLADLMGVPEEKLFEKVVWRLDEIIGMKNM